MNIALIGYGRMGQEIEKIAIQRGHSIKIKIDKDNQNEFVASNFGEIDAAIEFSFPEAAFSNIKKCLEMKIPVVSGTTGWLEHYNEAVEICMKNKTSFISSSNFSVGVNILFKLNAELAKIMNAFKGYSVSIEEIHHTKKLDAPSGTAISLAKIISKQHNDYTDWCFDKEKKDNCIPIHSIREGLVPGIHTVEWNSDIDCISLKHDAHGRTGFAFGAVLAAEYIKDRKGVFSMNDVLGF
jgi:4-hydroxy-tetrahydrodipicolinate reductase